jgi:hypothetical protein
VADTSSNSQQILVAKIGRPRFSSRATDLSSNGPKRTLRDNPPALLYISTWCRFISKIFDAPIYLVGSSINPPELNDINLRCVMADDIYDLTFGGSRVRARTLGWIMTPEQSKG